MNVMYLQNNLYTLENVTVIKEREYKLYSRTRAFLDGSHYYHLSLLQNITINGTLAVDFIIRVEQK